MINKAQFVTSGQPKSWGFVVLQGFHTLASSSSGDTKSLRKPSSLATADRYVQQQKMKKPTLLLDFKTEIKTKYLNK